MKPSLTPRKVITGLAIAGMSGAALFLPAIYVVGLSVSPPRPTPSSAEVPAIFADAVWSRIDGGRAPELRPVNPFNLAGLVSCEVFAEFSEREAQSARREHCGTLVPGLQASAYYARLHLRDQGIMPGHIRYAFAGLGTGAWITRAWSKAELVRSLAAHADYGLRWKGALDAAMGYFGKPLIAVTLPQAAMLAAFIGTVGGRDLGMASSWIDPWCDPEGVAARRRHVLEKMRDNGVIDDAALEAADQSALGLVEPPARHKACGE